MSKRAITAVGIDGCRGGWIAAVANPDGQIDWMLRPTVRTILDELPTESTVLVDMIIGLPDQKTPVRQCDLEARRILSPHGSRVFPAPPREALAAETYPEACALARAATGKAISKQCWMLFPKIRELDGLNDTRLRESHPEVVLARFNGSQPVAASKKTTSGQMQRLDRLKSRLPGSDHAYKRALSDFPRKAVARDDLIDALVLCAAAGEPSRLSHLRGGPGAPAIWF